MSYNTRWGFISAHQYYSMCFCSVPILLRRRKCQPTPVFLPRESRGQRSLVGWCPWGCTESDTTEAKCMHALEKEMATHSSVLAWRIPGTEEPGGLLSVGSHRVRHNWSDLAAAAAYCYCLLVIVTSIPTSKRPKVPSCLNQFLQPVVLSLTSLFRQAYKIWD